MGERHDKPETGSRIQRPGPRSMKTPPLAPTRKKRKRERWEGEGPQKNRRKGRIQRDGISKNQKPMIGAGSSVSSHKFRDCKTLGLKRKGRSKTKFSDTNFTHAFVQSGAWIVPPRFKKKVARQHVPADHLLVLNL